MRPSIILAAMLIAGVLGGIAMPFGRTAAADDVKTWDAKPWRYNAPNQELPFPRGERAQSVWGSGTCWSECGSYCAWGSAGCLTRDAQGHCLKLTDTCDRYCQRSCRTGSGPLLPLDFSWD